MTRSKARPTVSTHNEIVALVPEADRFDVAVTNEDDRGRNRPGLQVRVFPSGKRSFRYRYHLHGTACPPFTLGPFPSVSLSEARRRHAEYVRLVDRGEDPGQVEADRRAEDERKRRQAAAEVTVAAAAEDFITHYLQEERKRPEQAEFILRKHILPAWGGRKVRDITRRDGVLLARRIKVHSPVMANHVKALAVQLLNFAAEEGHIAANPLAGLRRPTKEKSRERTLTVDEIRQLWNALDARVSVQQGGSLKKGRSAAKRGSRQEPRLTLPMALALKLLVVTAQRRGELMGAKWAEFNLEGKLWTIPGSRTKNGKEHTVPLSELATAMLRELRELSKDSEWLFPPRQKARRKDQPMTEAALTRAAARNQCDLEHWTPHDLRRSAASHMNRIGVDALVVERVLNHELGGVLGIYNRHSYATEKADALDRWDTELRAILAGKSNVVALPVRAQA